MTRGDIEAQILKNLIMNEEYLSQEELKKVVRAMETPEPPKFKPYNQHEEVETRWTK